MYIKFANATLLNLILKCTLYTLHFTLNIKIRFYLLQLLEFNFFKYNKIPNVLDLICVYIILFTLEYPLN